MRLSPAHSDRFRLPLLLLAGALLWMWATRLWTAEAWQTPVTYAVDGLETLARLKLSGEKGLAVIFDKNLPALGAPWGADWSAYPMPDAVVFVVFGWIARGIGLMPASNLALLFSHLSALAVFYACSRALGHRPVFAAAAALCFGFSFYIFYRGLSHYSFALAYVVPAQLLSAWLIGASRQLVATPRWRWFCLGTAVATGAGNPYFGFAYFQLLAFALAYQAGTARRQANLRLGALCGAVFAGTLLAFNYSAIGAMLGGHANVLERNYAGTEIYGLRLIELFLPSPAHHWVRAVELAHHYASVTSLKGELFYSYFGLAGIGGLAVVIAGAAHRLWKQRAGLRPAHAATMLWLALFFMVGGINSLLALAGIDLFRAGNRYSIYLLALALFALAAWASRRGRKLGRGAAVAVTLPLVALCLWDQIPRALPATERAAIRQKIADDRAIAQALATRLPRGAAVFQLPAVPFLEQPPVNRMGDYELFRPWLFADQGRFSYGLLAGEKALRWDRWVAARPPGMMCAALEQAGFAALYLHKAAFADAGAGWRAQLVALGKAVIFDSGDHLVFALQPAAHPQLPDLNDGRLDPPWNPPIPPTDGPQIFAAAGWFDLEHAGSHAWRWAGGEATLTVWCPGDRPQSVALEFGASAMQAAPLSATVEGREVWRVVAGQLPGVPVKLVLPMQPGTNHVTFHYMGRVVRPSVEDPRQLGFRLDDLRADFAPAP